MKGSFNNLRSEARNMFDPRFGKKPARFIGREDVLRDIRAALNDTDESERVAILSGVKGFGKTSVLSEVRAGIDPDRASIENFSVAEPLQNDRGGKGKAVYFVDDASCDTAGLHPFIAGFAERISQDDNVMLLLAGLPHDVDELVKDSRVSFLRRARRYALGAIHIDEVAGLYKETLLYADEGADAEDERNSVERALTRAAEATAGYPYMIQLIGYYLSKEEKTIDDIATDKAIFLAKTELYKNVHDPLVWGLSSKDRMFLWAMAQDEGHSEFGEIARRMDVSAGYASKYRERLINAGVIFRSAYGELAFTLPFMKEYVEKEYIERLGGEGGKRRL
jgi:DNA-binding MarR family transcriptional regulator